MPTDNLPQKVTLRDVLLNSQATDPAYQEAVRQLEQDAKLNMGVGIIQESKTKFRLVKYDGCSFRDDYQYRVLKFSYVSGKLSYTDAIRRLRDLLDGKAVVDQNED